MAKIFFTSDLHFSHKKHCKILSGIPPGHQSYWRAGRVYDCALERDLVSPEDVVYNLGDAVCQRVPAGRERLVPTEWHAPSIYGNHDQEIRQHIERWKTRPNMTDCRCCRVRRIIWKWKLPEINNTLILFHYPIHEWDGCHKGWYHLHGHIHDRVAEIQGRIWMLAGICTGVFWRRRIFISCWKPAGKIAFRRKIGAFPIVWCARQSDIFLRQKMEIING